jgi:uncharacterized protein YdaU (DUF1376 family)
MSKKTDIWMPIYIADYLADTMHLSTAEHGAYLLIIMAYWRNRQPIPKSRLKSITRMDEKLWETSALVLAEFFIIEESGGEEVWRHERIDLELAKALNNKEIKSINGKLGGRPKKLNESYEKANGNLNIKLNESPSPSPSYIKAIGALPAESPAASPKKGTRLPKDWQPSDDLMAWSKATRPDLNLTLTLDSFRDFWASKAGSGGVKLDWDATWRNWVRKETQKPVDKVPVRVNVIDKPKPESKAERDEAFRRHMENLGVAV